MRKLINILKLFFKKNNKISKKKNVLVILGAGASKSLTWKEKAGEYFVPFVGSHQGFPTGDELIQVIGSYRTKAFCWLITYCSFKLFYASFSPSVSAAVFGKFIEFARDLELYYPRNETYYHEKDEDKKIEDEIGKIKNKLSEYRELYSSAPSINDETRIIHIFKRLHTPNVKIMRKIYANSEYIRNLLDQPLDRCGLSSFTKLVFFDLLGLISTDYDFYKMISAKSNMAFEYFYKSIYESIDNMCSTVVSEANKIRLPRIRLMNHNLSDANIYSLTEQAFSSILGVLEKDDLYQMGNRKRLEKSSIASDINSLIHQMELFLDELNNSNSWADKKFLNLSNGNLRGLFGIESKKQGFAFDIDYTATIEKVKKCISDLKKINHNISNDIAPIQTLEILGDFVKLMADYGFSVKNYLHQEFEIYKKIMRNILIFLYQSCFLKITSDVSSQSYKDSTLDNIKGIVTSSAIVAAYSPYSIDYFMMNIESLAPYEFYAIKGDDAKVRERKQSIHKFTKLIMANYLCYSSTYAHNSREDDNYIKRILWKLMQSAHFHSMNFDWYIKNYFNIISFNYDLSFETILYEHLSKETVEHLQSKHTHSVYGKIYLEVSEDRESESIHIWELKKDAIWDSLFFNSEDEHRISFIYDFKSNGKKFYACKDILSQINDRIKWIGEADGQAKSENDRAELQSLLLKADEVYFLGFGFDFNNLYQIGIIDKLNKLDPKIFRNKKRIDFYVSGSTPKIIAILQDIFNGDVDGTIPKLPIMKVSKNGIKFTFSEKYLPEALSEDLM